MVLVRMLEAREASVPPFFTINADAPLSADARMRAMPWVAAQVWVPLTARPGESRTRRRVATTAGGGSEQGRRVGTQPWPGRARTIWGDAANVGTPAP